MSVTYPLSIPANFGVRNSSFRLVRAIAESQSPFTYQQQTYDWGGARWEGEVTLRPYTLAQSNQIKAFLAKMRGFHGTFLYGDPDFLAGGAQGSAGGTPLVKGAAQTGRELIVDGFPALTNGVLLAGDYIQLDTGASSELYMVVDDANTDSAGEVTLNIEPELRSSPADNEAVVINGAKGVFKLTESSVEWSSDRSKVTSITISFKEAL